ncbi:hypothetical protein SAMN05216188_11567 [Lentzea xinjiangensis]|uniref:Uncharacterized protein n=1 Tax=Lentzea xinjiangensis TaxID=402600 RepID=A0A1H9RV09_9PSEU|nr:hypothetical protein [Lentzea xinjiangensis]SER76398.1 hypothetical protein SAMN05216188_11567 [Lentzea xinjiangensis]
MRPDRTGRAGTATLVMGASAQLLFSSVACADEPAQDDSAARQTTSAAGTEQHEYFGSDQFVGDEVIVSAVVTEVLGKKSFVLDGGEYGDESLLVLSAENADALRKGDVIQVSGIVERFRLADYRDRYGLLDDGAYRSYADEEFLVAQDIWQDVPASWGTTTPPS